MSVTLKNVSRTFGNSIAVKNIDLHVEQGEIIGLLGTSGCGKSTLLRAISGLDTGYRGEILLNGEEKRGVNESTGFIFQESRLFPWLTVEENVAFGLKETAEEKRYIIVQNILNTMSLEGKEKYYPRELSGGMAQRVAIARSLVTKPEFLLLDEPFSSLDAFTKMQLQDLLLDIWEEIQTTMILVTHDIDEALYLCDRIVVLSGQPGQIQEIITVKEERPRRRDSQELTNLKGNILSHLNLYKGKD